MYFCTVKLLVNYYMYLFQKYKNLMLHVSECVFMYMCVWYMCDTNVYTHVHAQKCTHTHIYKHTNIYKCFGFTLHNNMMNTLCYKHMLCKQYTKWWRQKWRTRVITTNLIQVSEYLPWFSLNQRYAVSSPSPFSFLIHCTTIYFYNKIKVLLQKIRYADVKILTLKKNCPEI